MQRIIATIGCSALLGCGFSSAEVSVGDALTIGVHHSAAGRTSVAVMTAARTCTRALVSVDRDALDARLQRC